MDYLFLKCSPILDCPPRFLIELMEMAYHRNEQAAWNVLCDGTLVQLGDDGILQ